MKNLILVALFVTASLTAQEYNTNDILPHVYTVEAVINHNTVEMSLNGFAYKVLISNFKGGDLNDFVGEKVKLLKEHYGHDGTITALMFHKNKLVTFNN